jgi:putative FmdB family regulatory protein
MPLYDYACRACGHEFEIQQSFSDDALTECPECGGELRKVFAAPGITFKGSGFYKTDSAGSKRSTSSGASSDGGSGGSTASSGAEGAKSSESSPKTDSKPATPSTSSGSSGSSD